MNDKYQSKNSGSIMVISVLIMSIMGMIVFGLSGLVIRLLEMSRNLDNSIMAYYGAEGGMEAGLFYARKLNIVSIDTSGKFENNVLWRRRIVPSQDHAYFKTIKKNNIIELDLYDPDDQSCSRSIIMKCEWESMLVEWNGDGELAVTLTEWDRSPFIDFNPEGFSERRIVLSSSPAIINEIDTDSNYRVTIKAYNMEAQSVKVSLFDDDDGFGNVVPVPNILTIIGTGRFGNSNRSLSAVIPRSEPLSSLYDYIIFSEDDIVKEF